MAATTTSTGLSVSTGTSSPATAPVDPKPISDALQRHFDSVLTRIPSGKRVRVDVAGSTDGIEGSIGVQAPMRIGTVTSVAYAGRDRNGGWLAGGRVSWVF